jgi:hypothetical protein
MADHTISESNAPRQIRVRYEQTEAVYASQFALNVTEDEIIINFSSGSLPDPNTGDMHLPIHTRIALSPNGAKNLLNLLTQALNSTQNNTTHAARLPPLNS